MVTGRTLGLKPAELKALEKLKTQRIAPDEVLSKSLAERLGSLSAEINRRIGVLIDRRGRVTHVAVGDASRIWVPEFGRVRAGSERLRGLRWVITHVTGEALTRDDLTDLMRLRFDMVISIEAMSGGEAEIQVAHLRAQKVEDHKYEIWKPQRISQIKVDFQVWVEELEAELNRAVQSSSKKRGAGPRAILAYVQGYGSRDGDSVFREMKELARTAGVEVVSEELQKRQHPDPNYVFGRGRMEDLVIQALEMDVEMIVFGQELSPAQMRGLSRATELKIIDRTQLILDIFAQHAKTREGKLQVELAQMRYLLPRLQGRHTALSRLAGGIGGRGPGETKLETDRRRVNQRIHLLDQRIEQLAKQRLTQRRRRQRNQVPVVGIVGYTNAGKSTLLNTLTGSEVIAENQLFATLDPTTRRLRFPQEKEIVLADTVGFIQDLPPDLVRAFRATLEELAESQLLIHVVDISDPDAMDQITAVTETLDALELSNIPVVPVLNKVDQPHDNILRAALRHRYNAVCVSAIDAESLRPLIGKIGEHLFELKGEAQEQDLDTIRPFNWDDWKKRNEEWSPLQD